MNCCCNVDVLASLKHRRVMHYGYKFDYAANAIDRTPLPQDIPVKCLNLVERLHQQKLISQLPDQMTVNQYQPGQGNSSGVWVYYIPIEGGMVAKNWANNQSEIYYIKWYSLQISHMSKLVSHRRQTCQNKAKDLSTVCIWNNDECKIIRNIIEWLKKYVFGCHVGLIDRRIGLFTERWQSRTYFLHI